MNKQTSKRSQRSKLNKTNIPTGADCPGVYCLIVGRHLYIGQTTKPIYERIQQHISSLIKAQHHCYELQEKATDNIIYIPLIPLDPATEKSLFIAETLESLILGEIPLNYLLNSCCYKAKPEHKAQLEIEFPQLIEKVKKSVKFIRNCLEHFKTEESSEDFLKKQKISFAVVNISNKKSPSNRSQKISTLQKNTKFVFTKKTVNKSLSNVWKDRHKGFKAQIINDLNIKKFSLTANHPQYNNLEPIYVTNKHKHLLIAEFERRVDLFYSEKVKTLVEN